MIQMMNIQEKSTFFRYYKVSDLGYMSIYV
jgi:hypothetical protein